MINHDPARRVLLTIRCPHCHVPAGQRCVVPSNAKPLTGGAFHQARRDALLADTPRGAA